MRLLARLSLVALLAQPGAAIAETPRLLPALERLAEAGNAEAIYHIGMAYHVGLGVPQDHAKALAAFRQAEALGDPLGAYKLGCYYGGQGEGLVVDDPALALKYKLVAAEAGYALAQHDVGVHFVRSDNIPLAQQWLEKAAAQGSASSLMVVSAMYNGAPGVKPDAAKTLAYRRLGQAQLPPNEKMSEWITAFADRMSPEDRQRANEIVRNYQPVPTPLTIKAKAGQRAAQALVDAAA